MHAIIIIINAYCVPTKRDGDVGWGRIFGNGYPTVLVLRRYPL